MKGKVLVAMSGGVDSSVTAKLLMQEGYEVAGAHMRLRYNTEYDKNKSDLNVDFVKNTCKVLGIDFHLVELNEPFQKYVVDPFLNEYKFGVTPNPCIYCNMKIKFGELFSQAKKLGFDYLATGHYTNVKKLENGRLAIHPVNHAAKDQAYYLYGLPQDVLQNSLFPLAEYQKPEVREIARKYNLPAADRPESQEICFVDGDYREFLKKEGLEFSKGNIVDSDGKVLAAHNGKENYTVGQRKGLNIAVGEPMYVLSIKENNDVVVGEKDKLNVMKFSAITVKQQGLSNEFMIDDQVIEVLAQVRYNSTPVKAKIVVKTKDVFSVELMEPAFAVTPGQAVVFYHPGEKYILGGGQIQLNL